MNFFILIPCRNTSRILFYTKTVQGYTPHRKRYKGLTVRRFSGRTRQTPAIGKKNGNIGKKGFVIHMMGHGSSIQFSHLAKKSNSEKSTGILR